MPQCPPRNRLREYAIGLLNDSESEVIDIHLAECTDCESSVASLEQADDSLLRTLPLVGKQRENDQQPAWLNRLKKLPTGHDEFPDPNKTPDVPVYELLEEIGRGGMSVVYRARHRELDREVAVKVLRPKYLSASGIKQRFQREIKILGSLQHPGIVMATDAGRGKSGAYLVMELIDGVDLAKLVRQTGPLRTPEASEIGRQMAAALQVAHQQGAIHRDLKPSNVMLSKDGQVKLLDFGLAHLTAPRTDPNETSMGQVLGTLAYMAPEQINEEPISEATDLFGLGATMFFLLTGRAPHDLESEQNLIQQLRSGLQAEPPRVADFRADISPKCDQLVFQLMSKSPEDRPNSAVEVAEALEPLAGGTLHSRVAEYSDKAAMAQEVSVVAPAATLSKLIDQVPLGSTSSKSTSTTKATVRSSPPSQNNVWKWIALAMFPLATWLGITLIVKLQDSTFVIESEVGDIKIEAVDEKERVSEIRIKKGTNETTLRAGNYKIRIAGGHDEVALNKDAIELRRGRAEVARIYRRPTSDKSPNPSNNLYGAKIQSATKGTQEYPYFTTQGPREFWSEPGAPSTPAETPRPNSDEPVYRGKSEGEWEQIFATDNSPEVRLAAAAAICSFAESKSTEVRLENIRRFGPLLLKDGGVNSGDSQVTVKTHGSRVGEFLGAHLDLHQRIIHLATSVPPQSLANDLNRQFQGQRNLTFHLLDDSHIRKHIATGPVALSQVIEMLAVDYPEIQHAYEPCKLLADYAKLSESQKDRREIEEWIASLTKTLLRAAVNGPEHEQTTRSKLLTRIRQHRDDFELSKSTAAQFVLVDVLTNGKSALDHHFQTIHFNDEFVYSDKWQKRAREKSEYFIDEWFDVANKYIRDAIGKHGRQPNKFVLQSFDYATRMYFDGDDWPAEDTAYLLTQLFYEQHMGKPANPTKTRPVSTASPELLLTCIARLTGEIPKELVREPSTKYQVTSERFERLQRTLNLDQNNRLRGSEYEGLMVEAPYQCIRVALRTKETEPMRVLAATMGKKKRSKYRTSKTLAVCDPILFLAVADQLAGESFDGRIAAVLAGRSPDYVSNAADDRLDNVDLDRHLRDCLSGPWSVKHVARKQLISIATKAKKRAAVGDSLGSSWLVEQICEIYPGAK